MISYHLIMAVQPSRAIGRKELKQLTGTEEQFRRFVEEHLLDEDGLVYSYVRQDTLRPWTNTELQAAGFDFPVLYRFERGKAEEVLAYEDTLMATAEYGLSQIERFRATGAPGALASAERETAALLRVLFEGEKHEKGYLPKPHGGMRRAAYSHEISPDQYIKTVVTLRAFQPYAPPAQQRVIDAYLVAMANYFINRNFVHPYRDRTLVAAETHVHALSLYVPLLMVAANITGQSRYRELLNPFDPLLDRLAREGYPATAPNFCALFTEGFHLAMREGLRDARLPRIIKDQWERNLAMVAEDGLAWNSARTLKSARSVRLVSAAPLVDLYHPPWKRGRRPSG